MKPKPICVLCILNRVYGLLDYKGLSDEEALRILKRILKFLYEEFDFSKSTTLIGTRREEILKELLGEEDPYAEMKKIGNQAAKRAWELIKDSFPRDYSYESFRKVMIVAAAANAMEWFIQGYEFKVEEFPKLVADAEKNLAVDDTKQMYEDFKKARTILYALDNAGEAVIDLEVVRYLAKAEKRIIVAARSIPLLNDVTYKEALELGFGEVAEVIPSGPYVGFALTERTPEEFKRAIEIADMLILKGMGNYEGVIEYKLEKPTYSLLRAKCPVVAGSLGVEVGKFAVKKVF